MKGGALGPLREPSMVNGAEGAASSAHGKRLATRCLRLSGSVAGQLIRDAIAGGGEMWVKGSGQSMFPTIRNADAVLLSPMRRLARRGDIVLLPLGPGLVLHRVVEATRDQLVTRGDARPSNDLPTHPDRVIARAVAVRRDGEVRALVPTLRFGLLPLARLAIQSTRRRVNRGTLARLLRRRRA